MDSFVNLFCKQQEVPLLTNVKYIQDLGLEISFLRLDESKKSLLTQFTFPNKIIKELLKSSKPPIEAFQLVGIPRLPFLLAILKTPKSNSSSSSLSIPSSSEKSSKSIKLNANDYDLIIYQPSYKPNNFPATKFQNETLEATIIASRRITSRNRIRWIQQLISTVTHSHLQFLSWQGNLSLDHVFLQSDAAMFSGYRDFLRICNDNKSEYALLKPKDIKLESRLEKMEFGHEHERHTWYALETNANTPGALKDFGELRGFPSGLPEGFIWIQFKVDDEEYKKIEEKFLIFAKSMMNDWKTIGIIYLQLLSGHLFNESELNYWKDFVPNVDSVLYEPVKPILQPLSPTPSPSKPVETSTNVPPQEITQPLPQSKLNTPVLRFPTLFKCLQDGSTVREILFQIANKIPEIHKEMDEIKELIALCFFPLQHYPIQTKIKKTTNNNIILDFSYRRYFEMTRKVLEEKVKEDFEDTHYVKKIGWTRKDEEKRLE